MTATLIAGGRVLPGPALQTQIERAAAALAGEGLEPGDGVALLLRNDFAFFIASLAARRAGVVTTPINWHATPEEIDYVLADSNARLVIGHIDLLTPLKLMIRTVAVPTPEEIVSAYRLQPSAFPTNAVSWADWLDAAPADAPLPTGSVESTMIYTSGTTGKPKGVRRRPMTAAQAVAMQSILAIGYGLSSTGPVRVLMTGPMYHSAPNSYGTAAANLAEVIVMQPRFDAEELLQLIAHHRITHMHMVPTMFVRLLALPDTVRHGYDLSSLRFVVHGAAPCPPDIKRRMIDWWGSVIHEYYGSTETGLITGHGSVDALGRPGTVGTALPGVTIKVFGNDGTELPAGRIGDIYVHSAMLPDFTYHGRPDERTAMEHDGLVTIGDVGWLDVDGFLFLCDRRRDMIISGGVNIYPAEIEAALVGLRGVRDCAVFGIPDAEFGEAVCAHIELHEGHAIDAAAVRAALGMTLARYKLPKVIEFASALPREDSGKIFKRCLREPYWAATGRSI